MTFQAWKMWILNSMTFHDLCAPWIWCKFQAHSVHYTLRCYTLCQFTTVTKIHHNDHMTPQTRQNHQQTKIAKVQSTCAQWTTVIKRQACESVLSHVQHSTERQPMMTRPCRPAASTACRFFPWSTPYCVERTSQTPCQTYNKQKHEQWTVTTSLVSNYFNTDITIHSSIHCGNIPAALYFHFYRASA